MFRTFKVPDSSFIIQWPSLSPQWLVVIQLFEVQHQMTQTLPPSMRKKIYKVCMHYNNWYSRYNVFKSRQYSTFHRSWATTNALIGAIITSTTGIFLSTIGISIFHSTIGISGSVFRSTIGISGSVFRSTIGIITSGCHWPGTSAFHKRLRSICYKQSE